MVELSDFERKRHSVQKLFEYDISSNFSRLNIITHRVISGNDSSILVLNYRLSVQVTVSVTINTYKWHVGGKYFKILRREIFCELH